MIAVGDKVNTFAGSVAIVLAIEPSDHGDLAQIEIVSLNNVGDRIFSGVPLWSLTPLG